eukprot:m.163633 g.163633  ORF g.163633 m.163633 type:complete len:539 (+) comp16556_c0_seq1:375-1991(+)
MLGSYLLATIALLAASGGAAASSKPHILLIVADDLGFGDLGYTGSSIKTPTIDALAKNGTIMGHYYVNLCCSPTRSMLHTGRYNIRYGLQTGVIPNNKEYGLNLTETLLPEYLSREGYATHALGKWHLGLYRWDMTPTFRGYDSFYGYYSGSQDYYTHKDSGYDFHDDVGRNCGPNCSIARLDQNGIYSTYLYAERAQQVIEAHDPQQPLFMYMAFQSVHCPIQAPASFVAPYSHLTPERQTFAGMVAALDEGIANITEMLKFRGMWDDTLVIFTTDNGGPVGANDDHPAGIGCATGSQNYPLRGGKGSYFQGGVRGTSWVYSNRLHSSRQGTTNYELTHVTDWLPTLVQVAGGNASGPWPKPLDGVSQYSMLFEGEPSPRDHLLINIERDNPTTAPCQGPGCTTKLSCNGLGQYAVIKGNYKLLLGGGGLPNAWYHDDHPYTGNASVPQGGCITACCVDCCEAVPYVQVYDVLQDEGEHNNLATSRPDLVQELMEVVHLYNNSVYVEALMHRLPVETKCPYNDDRGVLTPCWIEADD